MNPRLRQRARRFLDDDTGQVTAFAVILTAAALFFAGLVLDGGLALAAKINALGQAQEAARAGAQEIDLAAYREGTLRLDPTRATAAAQHFLATTGNTGTITVAGNTVTVIVTITHPTQLLTLVGIGSLNVSATGTAEPQRGVVTDP